MIRLDYETPRPALFTEQPAVRVLAGLLLALDIAGFAVTAISIERGAWLAAIGLVPIGYFMFIMWNIAVLGRLGVALKHSDDQESGTDESRI